MGLTRLPGEEENVTAIVKGTHEQVCTRHAAATAVTKPQVARCYKTKAMMSYRESPRSDLFEDSQFESLTTYDEDDKRRALMRRHQDATRWILSAYMNGMHVSPDNAFRYERGRW